MEPNKTSEDLLKEIEKLQQEIKRMREDIDQSYYSIPKKEFETVTVKKIIQEVAELQDKRITKWRNWFLIVFSILSFFGYTQWSTLKERLKKDVDSKVQEMQEVMNKSLDDKLVDKLKVKSEALDKEVHEAVIVETEKQTANIRDKMESAQKAALKFELDTLRRTVDAEKLLSSKDALNQLKPLLEKAIETKDKALIEDFLDARFRWTFLSGLYEELDGLRVNYVKDYEFKYSTWANIGIADMFLYEENNSPIYKERAIEACNNALQRLPGYGTANAVRLIIHMIDYERQNDQDVKEREKKEALSLINTVNSGSSQVSSHETFVYLERNRDSVIMGKYIEMLHHNFPEEMELMSNRAKEYEEKRKNLLK